MPEIAIVVALLAALLPAGRAGRPAAAEEGPVKLGVWQPPAPGDFGPLTSLEAALGRKVDIVPWYQAWGSPNNSAFRADKIRWVHEHGAIPMITWEPWNTKNGVNQPEYSLRQIAAGKHDSYIRGWARAAARLDGPLCLRFAHEMNGNWYPWAAGVNGNSAADYIKAWRHVHAIFEAAGADNVQWVWSPNRDYPGATPLDALYPGDEYVDWVGIDGYNFGTEKDGQSWRSFNETFKATYDIVTALSARPVMIGETGSTEAGGDKAAWIREGLSPENLATNFPRLRAVIYFNQVGSGNWPLSTSEAAMRVFAEVTRAWLETPPSDESREVEQAEPGPTRAGMARRQPTPPITD